jgi:Icc-related predicted phosphoesterase
MRTLIIADNDSLWDLENLRKEPPASLLISCGDLADNAILLAARASRCQRIFAVKGNHDSPTPFPRSIDDLHFNVSEWEGVLFGGFAGSWKYKPRGHYLFEQDDVRQKLRHFPKVDVFVAHNSPRFIHDREDDVHFGFEAFVDYLDRARPRWFLHGHQHVNQETERDGTRIIGVYGARFLDDAV